MRTSRWTTLALGALLGCSGQAPLQMAPEATEHTPGRFIWYDLVTHDVASAQAFYGALLGWEFQNVPDHPRSFSLITVNGRPIGGLVEVAREEGDSSLTRWVASLSVTDVDAAAELVLARGGTIFAGPVDVPRRGRVAVVADPQGGIIALVRTPEGDPARRDTGLSDWLWHELWTHDEQASVAFYQELAGYDTEQLPGATGTYHILKNQGEAVAGVAVLRNDTIPTTWLPYVQVASSAEAADRVAGLGGRVLLPPDDRLNGAAIIEDPTGGVVALQQWPPAGAEGGE